MWDPVMLMQTFPRSHYGQFCATNAIWRSLGYMLGAFLVGLFFDFITPVVGRERAYFFGQVWFILFNIPALIFFLLFYRTWRKLGGHEGYVAPLPPECTKAAV